MFVCMYMRACMCLRIESLQESIISKDLSNFHENTKPISIFRKRTTLFNLKLETFR